MCDSLPRPPVTCTLAAPVPAQETSWLLPINQVVPAAGWGTAIGPLDNFHLKPFVEAIRRVQFELPAPS